MAMRGAGQPRWTAEEAQRVLDAWEESGQSGAAFARSIGVGYQRLSWWRRRLAQTGRAATSTLVPVIVRNGSIDRSPSVVMVTASGVRIEVHHVDAATARWVIAVVAGEGRT